jgi:hypothetical protein
MNTKRQQLSGPGALSGVTGGRSRVRRQGALPFSLGVFAPPAQGGWPDGAFYGTTLAIPFAPVLSRLRMETPDPVYETMNLPKVES